MPLAYLLNRVPGGGANGSSSSNDNNRHTISFSRMETISLEERRDNNEWSHNGLTIGDDSSIRRLPTLRDSAQGRNRPQLLGAMQRYFPLLCVAQTIVIGLLIFYLYWFQPSMQQQDHLLSPRNAQLSPTLSRYRVYTHGSMRARLLPDLVPVCDQRKHDLHFNSVKCASNNEFSCPMLADTRRASEKKPVGVPMAEIITTSKDGQRHHSEWQVFHESELECAQSECDTDSRTKLLIGRSHKQTIIGWGGAMTDSSINNILSLSTNGTMRLLDDYYGPNGLQFNIVRITMGGSDFSARFYTNDDKQSPNEPDDLTMSNFRLAPEDTLYKIPILSYIQSKYGGPTAAAAAAVEAATTTPPDRAPHKIKVFASMWSPPKWMKTNNHFNKGQMRGSISMPTSSSSATNATEERYYRALAELKRQFLLAYQRNSIKFWAMTVMNEPVFAAQPFLDFNTMIFPKHDYASYVAKYLGPMLKEHPELGHIKLMAHDDNRRFLLDFTEPTLNNVASGRYIDGVSVHGYADKDYHQMDTIYELNRHKNLFVLPTELCSGHLPWMQKALAGNWHRGLHYALDIIHSLQHSAAGWVDWNMALDMEGGPGWLGGRLDSPVLVDKDRDLYHKSPMFYVLGHFSRYIPAGSVRIQSSLINGVYNYPLETVTFKTPKDGAASEWIVTVILNANPHPIAIHIKPYESKRLFKVECHSDSITTIRYRNELEGSK